MAHRRDHKFLQISLFLLTLVQGSSLRSLQSDVEKEIARWRDGVADFLNDGRCKREKDYSNVNDLSNWMKKKEDLNRTRLLDITFPGTHHSASYDLEFTLNENDIYLVDYQTIEQGSRYFDILDDVKTQWICGYALTQSLSLSEQLEAGVRYLDLRFDFDSATNTWRNSHFLWGLEMSVLLEQVATFARAHPQEVVVLEFGTIYNRQATPEQKQDYADMITTIFEGLLIVPTFTDLGSVTFGELREAGTTVLAIVRDNDIANLGLAVVWDDQNAIVNSYAPTDTIDFLKSYNHDRLTDFWNLRAADSKLLYKLQWIFTPSKDYVQENEMLGNLYALAERANKRLSLLMKEDNSILLGNILTLDYVEIGPLFEILDLEQYADPRKEQIIAEESGFPVAAVIGIVVGVIMLIFGVFFLRKRCQSIESVSGKTGSTCDSNASTDPTEKPPMERMGSGNSLAGTDERPSMTRMGSSGKSISNNGSQRKVVMAYRVDGDGSVGRPSMVRNGSAGRGLPRDGSSGRGSQRFYRAASQRANVGASSRNLNASSQNLKNVSSRNLMNASSRNLNNASSRNLMNGSSRNLNASNSNMNTRPSMNSASGRNSQRSVRNLNVDAESPPPSDLNDSMVWR